MIIQLIVLKKGNDGAMRRRAHSAACRGSLSPPHQVAPAPIRQAIVTGGNSGIGAETVRALAAAGARVVLTSRDAAAGQEVAIRLAHEAGELKVCCFRKP